MLSPSTISKTNFIYSPKNNNQTRLTTSYTKSDFSKAQVNDIITFLKDNLDKNLTIDDIAQEFLLSSSSLKKIFKKTTGLSVIAYFKKIKMEAAKNLVRENYLNYTEIAEKLGFSSLHHFSASFKKYTGLSPSQYAEKRKYDRHDKLTQTNLIVNQRPWST